MMLVPLILYRFKYDAAQRLWRVRRRYDMLFGAAKVLMYQQVINIRRSHPSDEDPSTP